MSIEVRVPKEITEYKERIIFNLSVRQLLWGFIALTIAVGGYFVVTQIFHLGSDIGMYISMIGCVPAFAMGFIKSKEGFSFDKFVKINLSYLFGLKIRKYQTELLIDKIHMEGENDVKAQRSKTKKGKVKTRTNREFEISKKSCKVKRKEAKREIKAARADYKKAKRQIKKKIKKASSSKVYAADNQI